MENSLKIEFLTSFYRLFESPQIDINRIIGENDIYGTLTWNKEDDDMQDFRWYNYFNDETLNILIDICDFIFEHELNYNDKILVNQESLLSKLKNCSWNVEKAEKGIECLMLVSIRMMDEGEPSDSFFMHF